MDFPQGLPDELIEELRSNAELAIDQLFGFKAPSDMLAKLAWNSARVTATLHGPHLDRAFAVMDFVMTAWHLHEWVFHHASAEERERWSVILGTPIKTETDFGTALRELYPELQACESLANALKHRIRRKEDKSGVFGWIRSRATDGTPVDAGLGSWLPEVFFGGEVVSDTEFCGRVFFLWRPLLAQLGMLPEPVGESARRVWRQLQRVHKMPYARGDWTGSKVDITVV